MTKSACWVDIQLSLFSCRAGPGTCHECECRLCALCLSDRWVTAGISRPGCRDLCTEIPHHHCSLDNLYMLILMMVFGLNYSWLVVCLVSGEVFLWGSNKHGQLCRKETFLPFPTPVDQSLLNRERVSAVHSGWTHLIAQTGTDANTVSVCVSWIFGIFEWIPVIDKIIIATTKTSLYFIIWLWIVVIISVFGV